MNNIVRIGLMLGMLVIGDSNYAAKPVVRDLQNVDINTLRMERKFTKAYRGSKEKQARLEDYNLLDNELKLKWTTVLLSNQTSRIQFVPCDYDLKILAEAWIDGSGFTESNRLNLIKNLEIAKASGYNAILVRFDCTEELDSVKELIGCIRDANLRVVMTYTGRDSEYSFGTGSWWNPYIDPDRLNLWLAELSKLSDAMFLTWRACFVHTKLLPQEYFNYIANVVRETNPNILIFGEVFHGGVDPIKKMCTMVARVDNLSGYVVNNLGFYAANLDYSLNIRFKEAIPDFSKLKNIGQVVGYQPYYCSKRNCKLSVEDQVRYKKLVESEFNRFGLMTVTYLHDGCDDHQVGQYGTTDNLVYNSIEE